MVFCIVSRDMIALAGAAEEAKRLSPWTNIVMELSAEGAL